MMLNGAEGKLAGAGAEKRNRDKGTERRGLAVCFALETERSSLSAASLLNIPKQLTNR